MFNAKNTTQLFLIATLVMGTNAVSAENAHYNKAVKDAAFVEKNEVSTSLIAINQSNSQLVWNADKTKILVSTWKSQGAYDKFLKPYTSTSNNQDYAVWVSTVPQVKDMCSDFAAKKAKKNKNTKKVIDRRMKQYLGLNPEWQYDVVVEMWVSPEDMFRPCVDPEVTDSTCNINFGKENPSVKNIADYRDFYENLYYKSFRGSAGVPWTGLGYTYDWKKSTPEMGASEFILTPSTPYEIKQAVPTLEYCSK